MNVNLNTFASAPDVCGKSSVGGYSGKAVKPIALRFINEMASNDKLKRVPISGMGGIETWQDAAEFMALGCSTVQITTAVMQYGYRIIDDLILGLQHYMSERGIDQLEHLVGEQLPNFVLPSKLDRDTIVYPNINREKCIGCGRCYTSCTDGGHQAINFDPDTRQPRIIGTKCVGCHLCRLVCPTGAIGLTKRIKKKKQQ